MSKELIKTVIELFITNIKISRVGDYYYLPNLASNSLEKVLNSKELHRAMGNLIVYRPEIFSLYGITFEHGAIYYNGKDIVFY